MSRLLHVVTVVFLAPHLVLGGGHGGGGSESDTIEPADSKVYQLTYRSFDRFMKKNPLVLMEFYAPWCGHCQQLGPQYREAAKELAKADLPVPVVLAKMDDTNEDNRRLRAGAPEMFNFSSYPSLFVIRDGEYGGGWPTKGGKHEWYGGGREAPDIVFHMSALAKGLDPYDEEKKLRPGLYKKDDDYDPRVIRDLVPEEFDEIVLGDTKYTWIVEFYSDRCPYCKSLAPEMKKASKITEEQIPGKTRFGAVNSRVFTDMADRFKITGWPWVTSFHKGEKIEDMAGLGGADSVVNWAKKIVGMTNPEGGVSRLSDEFVSPPAWGSNGDDADATVSVSVGADGSTASVSSSLDDLIERAQSLNVLTKKKVGKLRAKLADGSSTEAKELKKLKKKLKPVDDAIAAAAAAAGGSGAGGSTRSGDAVADALALLQSVASRYPQHPKRDDKVSLRTMIAGLGQHLPCGAGCKSDFQQALRSPKVGPPRVGSRDSFVQWVCRLDNFVNDAETDCDTAKASKVDDSATADAKRSVTGPWDALIYAKDPIALAVVQGQADLWEAQDLEELEVMAVKYNLATEKKLASMRKAIRSGTADQNGHVKKLTRRLAPVMALVDEIKQLKKAAKEAAKEAAKKDD
jgi:thioredoxin-like negative regulator of GroEL